MKAQRAGGEEWMDGSASAQRALSIPRLRSGDQGCFRQKKALTQTYAKCILLDYSYKFFYNDGYGKDFNILNLAEEREDETRPLYLTACLLSFYQQWCRRSPMAGQPIPYLPEAPLMVFVGGSVTGQRHRRKILT